MSANREVSFPQLADFRLAKVACLFECAIAGNKEGSAATTGLEQLSGAHGAFVSVVNCEDHISLGEAAACTKPDFKFLKALDYIPFAAKERQLLTELSFPECVLPIPCPNYVIGQTRKFSIWRHTQSV